MRPLTALVAVALAVTMILPLAAADSATYKGGATAVLANENGERPPADSGHVICNPTNGTGQGGVCFPYAGHDSGAWSVHPVDNSGAPLAYRVCLIKQGTTVINETVDGDAVVTGDCDAVGNNNTFSHGTPSSGPHFRNPTQILAEPVGVTYEWIIVFLCDAIMESGPDDSPKPFHSHGVTIGTVSLDNVAGTAGFVPPEALCGGNGTHTFQIQGVVQDPVSNPEPTGVPTLGQWGTIMFAATLAVVGMVVGRQRKA